MSNTILIILLVILICLSAFFSMTEITFSSVNKFKLKRNYDENPKKYKLGYECVENYSNSISTILVGNNLVNIASSSIATIICLRIWPEDVDLASTVSTFGITLIVLTFGEILPKLIGTLKANSLVNLLALPFQLFKIIFKPITFVVDKFVGLLSKIWTPKEKEPSLTDDELIDIVEDLEESNEIDEDKSDLIISAIEFGDTSAYDIMVPRVDVVGFDINDPIDEFIKNKELLSKSLVIAYEESLDNILGYIDTKDVMKNLFLKKKFSIKDLIHEVSYVNETKKIDDLLAEMTDSSTKIVVVVDEFGGTDGIIKLEDIFEELVGEIWDEKDKVELEYKKVSKSTYVVDGDMSIDDLFDLVEFDDDDFDSEYSTVSGLVSELLDKVPEANDEVSYKNLKFKVLEDDDTSATKIKVTIKK